MKKLLITVALLLSAAVHADTTLTNLSTRGHVGPGAENMHAGFVVAGPGKIQVLIKGAGPSMEGVVPGFQKNPAITLHNAVNGAVIHSNDNWQDDPSADLVKETGKAPTEPAESAFVLELGAGAYSVVQRGSNGSSGIGLPSVTQVTVTGVVPPPNGKPLPPEKTSSPPPEPTPTPTPTPQPQPQPNKPQNQILTERLIGNWVFNYKVVENFSQAYSLFGPAEKNPSAPGEYLVIGKDAQGDPVGGGYSPKVDAYLLVDETPLFWRSYVFNFDSDNRVSGCYHQMNLALTELSQCYPMNGNRTSNAKARGYQSPELLMEMVQFEQDNHESSGRISPQNADDGELFEVIEEMIDTLGR